MEYYLFKLKFLSHIHIGESEHARSLETGIDTFCADTLFSALCNISSVQEIEKLYRLAKENKLLLSDAMPYYQDDLYIPKPIISVKRSNHKTEEEIDKKIFKKLKYIPVASLPNYIEFLKDGKTYETGNIKTTFGTMQLITKASQKGLEQTMPYSVGLYKYKDGAGLYIIIAAEEENLEFIKQKLIILGHTGIGGKVSSGYGKFELEDDEIQLSEPCYDQTEMLYELIKAKSSKYMNLSATLPTENELEDLLINASYTLLRRGGFVQSAKFADRAIKKQTQYFFKSGSTFETKFQGDVYNVAKGGNHPVYRYAKPIFLGVNIWKN